MSLRVWMALGIALLLVSFSAVLLLEMLIERHLLRRYVGTLSRGANRSDEPFEWARALGGEVFSSVNRRPDPVFLTPLLRPLGATPMQVMRQGGWCSGISRLFIILLDICGVSAAQVTLYHQSGCGQHCLVEVRAGAEALLIDPSYGFSYHRSNGEPIGLESLQRGEEPHFRPLPKSEVNAYPPTSYYDFAYANTRTANWTLTRTRRVAYRGLALLTRGGIDRLRLPVAFEWPQFIVAVLLLLLATGIGIAAVL